MTVPSSRTSRTLLSAARRVHTGSGGRKYRHHVNPLAHQHQQPVELPQWRDAFARPHLPIHLDIGCATGEYVRALAERFPDRNFVGVDIRRPVIEDAVAAGPPLPNLQYLRCNVNVSVADLLQSLPARGAGLDAGEGEGRGEGEGKGTVSTEDTVGCERRRTCLDTITILHPDPWFKERHRKRRVVNAGFVRTLAAHAEAGTAVHLQSDVEEVFEDMRRTFLGAHAATGEWEREWDGHGHGDGAALFAVDPDADPSVPVVGGVRTLREKHVLGYGDPVWRTSLRRTMVPARTPLRE
jgi:tRNA (guanine-N7-)-methyltransferase